MKKPAYAIGIDLGTTNCVLSFVDLRVKDALSAAMPITQLHSLDATEKSLTLPSCYYFATPTEIVNSRLDPFAEPEAEPAAAAIGMFARERMNTMPGRVIHSAKSWLSHAGVDRSARLLPFGSDDIEPEQKLSPIAASAAYLRHLLEAWNHALAFLPEEEFKRLRVTVTVPASFDEDAQELTRQAAKLAGFAPGFRLLEEPQAAFYAWIEGVSSGRTDAPSARFIEHLPGLAERSQYVLVCDVGGGTSDFSLFQLFPPESLQDLPRIERVAVSDHLLLGGDNIDLALAHAVERILKPDPAESLSRRQWQHLVPQARLLKERILSGEGQDNEAFHVSIPGEGGSLFESALSAALTPAQVRQVILDGFFPVCGAAERPLPRQSGLREIGLPYAADTGISRHLAGFLNGQAIDAVLFAGGTLQPQFLRDRLIGTLSSWQSQPVIELRLEDMSLAIARGAAYFGAVLESAKRRIRGGHARSVYMEVHSERSGRRPELVCILPQGAEEGVVSKLTDPRFELLLHRPARFTAYTSPRRREDRLGDIVALDDKDFHPLPPLHTTLTLNEETFDARRAVAQRVQVQLEVGVTDLGVLQLALVSREHDKHWRLDFNLRKQGSVIEGGTDAGSAIDEDLLQQAQAHIALYYGKRQEQNDRSGHVRNLLRDLERLLGAERGQWDLVFLRALWPGIFAGMTRRGRSLQHENTWFYLAGLALRPGYGAELDPWRMTQLWSCYGLGIAHKKEKSAQANWWMMWRRVAGGLSVEQQETLFDAALPLLRKAPLEFSEGTRLLGALERIPLPRKTELINSLVELLLKGKASRQPQVYWALTRLLSRVPLYAGAESVLPPRTVETVFEKFADLDWKREGLVGLLDVFSAACRMTNTRGLDIHNGVRAEVLNKLKEGGAKEEQLRTVSEYRKVTAAERSLLFGEELPAGLSIVRDPG